jgi:hypothetical protein
MSLLSIAIYLVVIGIGVWTILLLVQNHNPNFRGAWLDWLPIFFICLGLAALIISLGKFTNWRGNQFFNEVFTLLHKLTP